jgi:SNF2 family DNA or RNA helicase
VIGNWQKEAARFTPDLPVMVHHGVTRAKGAAFKDEAKKHAAVAEDAVRTIKNSEGIQRKGVVLATLSKLKQVCNHPAQFLGDNSTS